MQFINSMPACLPQWRGPPFAKRPVKLDDGNQFVNPAWNCSRIGGCWRHVSQGMVEIADGVIGTAFAGTELAATDGILPLAVIMQILEASLGMCGRKAGINIGTPSQGKPVRFNAIFGSALRIGPPTGSYPMI